VVVLGFITNSGGGVGCDPEVCLFMHCGFLFVCWSFGCQLFGLLRQVGGCCWGHGP